MASYVTPKKNTAFTFYVALTSVADTDNFKTSPTLAAGDITVSKDGGNFQNIGTLPTQVQSTGVLPVALTADEMNADNVVVLFHDASGDEWQDLVVNIQTTARQVDDLAFPTTAGRSIDVTAGGAVGVDWANVEGATTTVALTGTSIRTASDVETDTQDIQNRLPAALVTGRIDASVGAMAAGVVTAAAIATGAVDADALAADAGSEIADAVWDEALAGHATTGTAGKTLNTAAAGTAAGAGAYTVTYTVTDADSGAPLADVDVWVTSDAGGSTIVASGQTNASGVVTLYLDAGTFYFWRQKSGYNFTNPDTETVVAV